MMKKKPDSEAPMPERLHRILLAAATLLVILPAIPTRASWYANARLSVVILAVHGVPEPVENVVRVPVTLHVLRFLGGDGHDPKHGETLVGKTRGPVVVFCADRDAARHLVPGTVRTLVYRTSSGLGFDPVTKQVKEFSGESWHLAATE